MRRALLQFWDRTFRRLLLAEYRPFLLLVRGTDGAAAEVDWIGCSVCKNYFWVQHAGIERPTCCPYCTKKFHSVELVSNAEATERQAF